MMKDKLRDFFIGFLIGISFIAAGLTVFAYVMLMR